MCMHIYKAEVTPRKLEVCRKNEGVFLLPLAGTTKSFQSSPVSGFSILNFSGNYVLRVSMVEKRSRVSVSILSREESFF